MPYYDTVEEDLARAKEILAKGEGTIYGADIHAAYRLLETFVEVVELMGPGVIQTGLRLRQRHPLSKG